MDALSAPQSGEPRSLFGTELSAIRLELREDEEAASGMAHHEVGEARSRASGVVGVVDEEATVASEVYHLLHKHLLCDGRLQLKLRYTAILDTL